MRRESVLAAAVLAAVAMSARAADDTEWNEAEVPPPPALRTRALVAVEVPGGSELRYGIDPESVAVGRDRVVRYVIVATSRSGAVNAMYEGVHCGRGEYRVFARSSGQGWHRSETEWRSLSEGLEGRRARAVALAGACLGHTPNGDSKHIVADLRAPPARKFGGSGT